MTTVGIAIVRGDVQAAKTLAAIDILSGGRLIAGIGPGSSARDYEAVGVPFDERWKRLDEMVQVLRAHWGGGEFRGRFYSSEGMTLEPRPARVPPIWIGSWGSDAGLRRTARLADGWLASAYNTTPALFADAWARLRAMLPEHGKTPERFPNAIATMFAYVTESRSKAARVVRDVVGRAIARPPEELAERLLIGGAEECAAKLHAYRDAGVQRVLVWPVADEPRQIELISRRVAPLVARQAGDATAGASG
jgi:alkanesulfonate monooxygenase SsuD/methylene tetrahydromethanopterin reductase-like flavin-dependent oxidoreductase (luciferase family)